MNYTPSTLRPSLAAITAAIALSATPAFAQTADTSAAPAAAPVTIAPPAPAVAPAAAAPAATDQTSNMSAPIDDTPAQPAAPVATQSPVVVHAAPASAAPAAAPRAAARTTVAPASVTKSAPTPAASPAPVAKIAAPAPAPAPVLRDPPPKAAQTQTKVSSTTTTDDTALYAGLGGAAVLILGGGAFALSRRRRDDEVAYEPAAYTDESHVAAAPIVATEPSYDTAPAAVMPMASADEEMVLANGFDLSRFGPHTRAAYRGPTEDNPSHSLKKRLKIASFRDGRLREAGELDEGYAAETMVEPGTTREARRVLPGKLADRLSFRPGARASFRPATA